MEQNKLTREIDFKGDLFSRHFIDSKSLFLYEFRKLPSITVVRHVDHEKVYRMLKQEHGDQLKSEYHYASIAKKKNAQEKEESVLLMQEEMVIELGDGYCEFYFHDPESLAGGEDRLSANFFRKTNVGA